jgi:heme exporter protein CcmD
MWGAYWVWDPRLTAELVLLFLYFGYMGLRAGIEDPVKADKASAMLAVVGVVNVPIIKFSVEWWNSLHQTATVMQTGQAEDGRRHVVAAAADAAGVRAVLHHGAADPPARRTAAPRAQCELGTRGADMNEFLEMGGYGKYLWPAFALGFGVVVLNLMLALNSLASAKQDARRRMEMNS